MRSARRKRHIPRQFRRNQNAEMKGPAEQELENDSMAYMLIPDINSVNTAKDMAFRPRVFSSKRIFRNSGTDLALSRNKTAS